MICGLLGLFLISFKSPDIVGRVSPVRGTNGSASTSEADSSGPVMAKNSSTSQNPTDAAGTIASGNKSEGALAVIKNRPAYLGGDAAGATVKIGGQVYHLQPNQQGDFGHINIKANTRAAVTISYPDLAPASPLLIESEDGGTVQTTAKKGAVTATGQLDSASQIAFNFDSGEQEGIYRVTLRQGADLKQIDFWVGPELPVATR